MELRDLLDSPGMSRDDLLAFAQQMEILDRHFPSAASMLLNDALCVGFELLKAEESRFSGVQVPIRKYWRFAFSRRIADAEAYRRLLAGMRRAAAVQGGAGEVEGILGRLNYEVTFPAHPLLERCWHSLVYTGAYARRTFALLRLLRTAAYYRATGEILELEDPFGKVLRHSLDKDVLRVWTVWLDGVDNQGNDEGVGWLKGRPIPVPGVPIPFARDVVLEVRR